MSERSERSSDSASGTGAERRAPISGTTWWSGRPRAGCRCAAACACRLSSVGERIALIAFRPSSLGGPYAEVGPVFVHSGDCPGHPAQNVFPPDFAGRRAVLRPYDAGGLMLAGLVAEPGESADGLERLFADPRVASVHVRNVVAGCWNSSVRRAPDLE